MATTRTKRTERSVVAATLLYVQAALVAVAGLSLVALAESPRRRFARRFFHAHLLHRPGLWGLLLIALAAGLVTIGIAVARRRPWAAVATYVAEAVAGLGGLVGFHPLRSVLGLVLAVAVVILVATDRTAQSIDRTVAEAER